MRIPLKFWHVLLLVVLFAPLSTWGANTMWSALSTLTGANIASGDRFVLLDISDTAHGAGGTAKTVTADELNTYLTTRVGGQRVYALASDYTSSSTTGTEIGFPAMTVSAAGDYALHCLLMMQSAATTTSPKFGVNYTGTTTQLTAMTAFPSAGVTAATGQIDGSVNATTGQVWAYSSTITETTTAPNMGPWTGVVTANENALLILDALMGVSNTGDIEVWAGSEVGASQITIQSGSVCVVTRVS